MKKAFALILIIAIGFSLLSYIERPVYAFADDRVSVTISGPSRLSIGERGYYFAQVRIDGLAYASMSFGSLGICLSEDLDREEHKLISSGNYSTSYYMNSSAKAISPGQDTMFFTLSGFYYDSDGNIKDYSYSKGLNVTAYENITQTPTPTPTPSPRPTSTPTPRPTSTPTPRPTTTTTSTTTSTVTVSPTPKPDATQNNTITPTPKPDATQNNTITPTPKPSSSKIEETTVTESPTPTPNPDKPEDWTQVYNIVLNSPNHYISLTMDESYIIPADILNTLKNHSKVLTIVFPEFTCTIDGTNISKVEEITEDLDIGFDIKKDNVLSLAFEKKDIYQLHFNHNGDLPCPIEYSFYAMGRQPDDELYLYYMNDQTIQIEAMQKLTVDTYGNVKFTIDHCSSYVICDELVETAQNNEIFTAVEPSPSSELTQTPINTTTQTPSQSPQDTEIPVSPAPTEPIGSIRIPKVPKNIFYIIVGVFIFINLAADAIIIYRNKSKREKRSK